MSSVIEFQHVWKQYQVGRCHQRLGEAIPALLKGVLARRHPPEGDDGKFWALTNVSFSVMQGQTLGIMGRNGSGKSTILKLLVGITTPARGRISVNGTMSVLIEVGAGFHPDLTGRENMFLLGTILGLKRRQIRRLFDRIVDFAQIGAFLDTPVKRYSHGMQMRLGFAIAAHVNAEILLIDEVLSVGDLGFQQRCLQRVSELKRCGTTILLVSHNLNAIQRICDRAMLLDRGEMIQEGAVDAVIRAYRERIMAHERKRWATLRSQADPGEGPRIQDVRIEVVRLRDQSGRLAETFEMGQPLVVEILYASRRCIDKPAVKISLERSDGLLCHVASTQDDAADPPPLDGQGVLRLRYPAMNLLPGVYRVSVEITEGRSPVPLDSRKDASFFIVRSDDRENGVVHLGYQWE